MKKIKSLFWYLYTTLTKLWPTSATSSDKDNLNNVGKTKEQFAITKEERQQYLRSKLPKQGVSRRTLFDFRLLR